MTAFRTLPDGDRPLRVAVVGAGGMGRAWLATVQESPDVELAGVVDLDVAAARAAAEEAAAPDVPVGASLTEVAAAGGADAVIDVAVPAAHLPVTREALGLGLPVLGEKPLAATLAEALRLVAAAELSGQLFMVSQSRRYNRELFAFRQQARRLGTIGTVTTEFFRAPRFGGFRDVMDHPLLLDMAIHPFDTARFLLGADPVSVYCEEYNPAWSWYRGDAATTAMFEMTGGIRYVYTGSWCSPGLETSWNGAWRVSGELGGANWDGDNAPRSEPPAPAPGQDGGTVPQGDGTAGALREFTHAPRTGTVPMGEVHDNVMSLAMVDAAVESARTGRRVEVDELLAAAHTEALAAAGGEDRELLGSWTSVREALGTAGAVVGA